MQPLSCRIHSTVAVEFSTDSPSGAGVDSPSGAGVDRSGMVSSMPVPLPQAGLLLSHHTPHMYGMLLIHNGEVGKPQDRVLASGMRVDGEMSTDCDGNLAQRPCAVRFVRAFTARGSALECMYV